MAVVQLKKVPDGMELEDVTEEEQKEMLNNLHKEPEKITDIKIIKVEEIPDDVKVVEVEEQKANEFVEKVEELKTTEEAGIEDLEIYIEKDDEEERIAISTDINGIKNKATYNKSTGILKVEEIVDGEIINSTELDLNEKTEGINILKRPSTYENTFSNYEFKEKNDVWTLRVPYARWYNFTKPKRVTVRQSNRNKDDLERFERLVRVINAEEWVILASSGYLTGTALVTIMSGGMSAAATATAIVGKGGTATKSLITSVGTFITTSKSAHRLFIRKFN